jgi:hypothetical protein
MIPMACSWTLMGCTTCTINVGSWTNIAILMFTRLTAAADNPTANVAGNQHWGHATSKDLFTWDNQPIAIFPGSKEEGVFSGSAVIDTNNTSGMFPNQTNGVVAIYTINTPEMQTQDIAFSHDGGYSFEKYENNPVIRPGGTNPTQFRDPKVIVSRTKSHCYRVTKLTCLPVVRAHPELGNGRCLPRRL